MTNLDLILAYYSDLEHGSVKSESMALHLTAAMAAGATATIITHPVWVVKTRFMVGDASLLSLGLLLLT